MERLAEVAHPDFSTTSESQRGPFDGLPAFKPLPADLPPNLASALIALRAALTEPPSLGDQWPFADPPLVRAAAQKARGGRPRKVQPHQAVMLARFVRLGDGVEAAATRAGLTKQTAYRILKGDHWTATDPAVLASGVQFPLSEPVNPFSKPVTNPEKAPPSDLAGAAAPAQAPEGPGAPAPRGAAPAKTEGAA